MGPSTGAVMGASVFMMVEVVVAYDCLEVEGARKILKYRNRREIG